MLGDFYWGFGKRIYVDSTMGKIIWESGGLPGCRANIIQNISKNQLLIWLDNQQSPSSMDNLFEALNIINGKTGVVKKAKQQAAAVYARALISEGEDADFAELTVMAADNTNYSVA